MRGFMGWAMFVVVLALLIAAVPAGAIGCSGTYFESARTGRLWLTRLEPACVWNSKTNYKLQRAGTCGEPEKANAYQVITHNTWCDYISGCPAVEGDGVEAGIAALKPGERVELCDAGRRLIGTVLTAIYVKDGSISPQSEFQCPKGRICGTAVTSFGPWNPSWGVVMGFKLVKIAYQESRTDVLTK